MKKMKKMMGWILGAICLFPQGASAQSKLYEQHFDIQEVELLDGPFKKAMDTNIELLLKYDADRLMTPFIRQAGLDKEGSAYKGWLQAHPSFENWGLSSWSLEGHVGGHYLTALSLAYAASKEQATRNKLKEKLDYCLRILKDCQDAFEQDTQGLKGFIGGQPINQVWTGLYANNLTEYKKYGGWVPFYCEHKILAGLRDAWVYAGSETAKDCFQRICDWSVEVVAHLSENDMQVVLGWEHGGMNETLADAYHIFGDRKYLDAAKKYNHSYEVNGMQGTNASYSRTFLNGQHANTQVPKFIGFERIAQLEDNSTLNTAALNFWDDVANHRTVCIGGNSVSEHFLAQDRGEQYITNLDGPESCNSNNMLKLSELLFDHTHDARYMDFYEQTVWNHILSTQDPTTGGYVYFTSLRPQSYRIYSQVNQAMWCCVGTGMENHSKYGHAIYTHNGAETLYVNLFTASRLDNGQFAITQETTFPYESSTRITVNKGGTFTLALRHPSWASKDFGVSVNGEKQDVTVSEGTASYVQITRSWKEGDVVSVSLPMSLRYEECPNYTDYIAFKYGPILLAAKTTASSEEEAASTGLEYESLQNEYGGEGRMDHAPGSMATPKSLSSSSLLLGERKDVMQRIKPLDATALTFDIDCRKDVTVAAQENETYGTQQHLKLEPFYGIHHARYSCYWYQQTPENYAASDMGKKDAEEAAINERTIDFVATGEQQSEAGHDALYSGGSTSGNYKGETYRDARSGEFIQYTLANTEGETENLAIMCRFTVADQGRRASIYIDGEKIANVTVPATYKGADENGFYNIEYPIPAALMKDAEGNAKKSVVFKIVASATTLCPGLYYLRLVRGYQSTDYVFHAPDWKTGDTWRLSQANISYDETANTLTAHAGTGDNNVCLGLDYANTDYSISSEQKYLIVSGNNLSTAAGKSYLWWLNGDNKGTSVPPTLTTTLSNEKEEGSWQVFAWDMTKSGIDSYNQGDRFSVCNGLTIFGLTSTTGTSTINYIGFEKSLEDYLGTITGVQTVANLSNTASSNVYSLQGRRMGSLSAGTLSQGVYIVGNKKVIVH